MILYFTTYFETFMVDGVLVKPLPYLDGWFLPLGWESVLDGKGIEYKEVEYVTEKDVF